MRVHPRLTGILGLSETDASILEFASSLHSDRLLDDAGDTLGALDSANLTRALSVTLAIPEAQICNALSTHGVFARSGVLTVDHNCRGIAALED